MSVRCIPIYLPWEFTIVVITAVYIPPDASADSALGYLGDAISSQQNRFPEAVRIIAGDFNHADCGQLSKFHQHVKCATWGTNILDKVYSNIKNGYRVLQLLYLGQSDHMSLLLAPDYISFRKKAVTVRLWNTGLRGLLYGCRIVLKGQIGTFLTTQTWRSILQRSWDILITV